MSRRYGGVFIAVSMFGIITSIVSHSVPVGVEGVEEGVVDVHGVFIVVAFYCPSVLEVVVAKAGDEGNDGLDKGVGGEEVAHSRVGEESALTLEAEHYV